MNIVRSFVDHPKESLIIFLLAATASLGGKCVTLTKQLKSADDTIGTIGARTVDYSKDAATQLYRIQVDVRDYVVKKYQENGKPYFHYTGNVAEKLP